MARNKTGSSKKRSSRVEVSTSGVRESTLPEAKRRVQNVGLQDAETTDRPDVLEPIPPNARRVSSAHSGSSHGSTSRAEPREDGAAQPAAKESGGESTSGLVERRKRGRGPSKDDQLIPPEGKRWKVLWDRSGCAVGKAGKKLTSRLAHIAKQGKLWPVDVTWRKQRWQSYKDCWDVIGDHFDLQEHPNRWDFCYSVLHERWKDWKGGLKKKYYDPLETDQERLQHVDIRVDPLQWKNMVSYWGTPKAKAISAQNKANRACKKMNHNTGSKSFARVGHEMREQRQQSPTPLDIYDKAYGSSTEIPSSSASVHVAVLSQMHDFVATQLTQQSETGPRDRVELEAEAISQILGPEKSDRVRSAGIGAMGGRPSRATGRGKNKMMTALEEENTSLKAYASKIEEKVEKMEVESRALKEQQKMMMDFIKGMTKVEKMEEESRALKEQQKMMMDFIKGMASHTGYTPPILSPANVDQAGSASCGPSTS